jgi:hypothetical protein
MPQLGHDPNGKKVVFSDLYRGAEGAPPQRHG